MLQPDAPLNFNSVGVFCVLGAVADPTMAIATWLATTEWPLGACTVMRTCPRPLPVTGTSTRLETPVLLPPSLVIA